MNSVLAQPFPRKEREECERNEERRVFDCSLSTLIRIDGLIQSDTERGGQQCRLGDLVLHPHLSVASVELEYLPLRIETLLADLTSCRQKCALKRGMRPI